MKMKIAVIIPAYNEAKRIGAVLKGLKNQKLDIFVIDDGSVDNTLEVIKKYNVFSISHKINLGKGAAVKTGCEAAFLEGADAVIMMDSDGQHKVDDLPKIIDAISSNKYDIVFGSRNLSKNSPFIRLAGNKIATFIIKLLFNIYVSDLICGYRALTKKAYKAINWQSIGYGVETEMVAKTGLLKLNYCEVAVETVYYDKFKGVTILDAFSILTSVLKWRLEKFLK